MTTEEKTQDAYFYKISGIDYAKDFDCVDYN